MKVLITGSLGLVGSEAVQFYSERDWDVVGVDNNKRGSFFGEAASVAVNLAKAEDNLNYRHYNMDICDPFLDPIFKHEKPDVILHTAAQPSHDFSASNPMLDFKVNAEGTLRLLEITRNRCPGAVFVYISTNKVYGDFPNTLNFYEAPQRYEYSGFDGFNESTPLDRSIHSPFGVSKLAGDLYTQEYAKYFGLRTGVFRCGCITGKNHKGTELHGFLSYMVKCKKENKRYKIYGYKGKQVRDNIHAFDLVTAVNCFVANPRPGEVYNMGGGRHSNVSVLEALGRLKLDYEYSDQPRKGDHIWYISDVSKFKSHYPEWDYKYDMEAIFADLLA